MADAPATPALAPRRPTAQTVGTVVAMVIGVAALVVSVFQARLLLRQADVMEEQQHTSVWPRLTVSRSFSDEAFSLGVSNEGIGPAQIRHVAVEVDGRPQRSWRTFLQATTGHDPGYTQSTVGNRIVGVGDVVQAVRVEGPLARPAGLSKPYDVTVCYCSVYERCWQISESFNAGSEVAAIPDPVERCPTSSLFSE